MFQKQNQYMKKGRYKIYSDFRFLYRDDEETRHYVEKVILKNDSIKGKSGIKALIKKLLLPKLVISDNAKANDIDYNGTIYLPSNDIGYEREAKIFNLESNSILTAYIDSQKLEKKIADYNYFSKYFNIPEILSYCLDKWISIERIIQCKPKLEWHKQDYDFVINRLFNEYISYFSNSYKNRVISYINIEETLLIIRKDTILKDITDIIDLNIPESVLRTNFPAYIQHGDLSAYNVLLRNNEIYIIDWEHSGHYIIFYDLFWIMTNEAIYSNNLLRV